MRKKNLPSVRSEPTEFPEVSGAGMETHLKKRRAAPIRLLSRFLFQKITGQGCLYDNFAGVVVNGDIADTGGSSAVDHLSNSLELCSQSGRMNEILPHMAMQGFP